MTIGGYGSESGRVQSSNSSSKVTRVVSVCRLLVPIGRLRVTVCDQILHVIVELVNQ